MRGASQYPRFSEDAAEQEGRTLPATQYAQLPARGGDVRGRGMPITSTKSGVVDSTPPWLPWIEDPWKVAPKDARELSSLFFERLQMLEEGTPDHQYARNTLIEMNLSLVHFSAKRFRNRGSGEMEDIIQVGTVGLIKAIDRFELSREVEFTSFAIPYIVGEIKRFFRDSTWAVHVPRRLQELRVTLAKTREELSGLLIATPPSRNLPNTWTSWRKR